MTNSGIFDEPVCMDKLKECKYELKRHKTYIKKLNLIIEGLEKNLEQKENEIKVLKNNG
jgi:superoxide dismutase